MMRAALILSAALSCWAPVAFADSFERLFDAMLMDEVLKIVAEEGKASALGLEESMFPGRGGPAWEAEVNRIYDVDASAQALRRAMEPLLSEENLEPLLAFLEDDMGQKIMTLEVSARRAFIDPDMEDIATEAFADAEETRPVLFAQVEEFTAVNNLIAQNVAGAFRSNVAFATGAHAAGAFPGATVEQLVAQMWGGDEAVKADIENWMYAYLMTAYSPLDPEELDAYIALSGTPAGQALNKAIMDGFGAVFSELSFALGSAAGRFAAQQDL